jgi:enediyne biosynthesis protein E4
MPAVRLAPCLTILCAASISSLSAPLWNPRPDSWVSFVDIAREAGLTSPVIYGGVERQKYILETTGTGVAVFDFDKDGRPDIFLVNGSRLDLPANQAPSNHLYRNLGGGRFQDVTEKAGLIHSGWGQAVCVGDFDNDGWTDLVVTSYGANILYRNRGDGSFEDVSAKAHIQAPGRWNSGCTFVDFDRDGKLDLFIANYADYRDARRFEPGSGPNCKWKGLPVMCGPMGLGKAQNLLYHNNGDGSFTDVSTASGVTRTDAFFCFMPVTLDYDGDGWPDIYVACDSSPNILYKNNRKGGFSDVGTESQTAYNDDGKEQASMGVAAGDFDGDGYPDLLVTNFSDDTPTLYRNNHDGVFSDVTYSAKLGYNTQYLSWGVGLVDLDNDGWKDIFIASGHVYPEVDRHTSGVRYRQARLVYRNLGNGTFEDVSAWSGPGIAAKMASRGAAFEDFDGDGYLDIVVVNLNEIPSLLKNQGTSEKKNWVTLSLEGDRSNRSAIGAQVRVTAGGRTQTDEVRSASSYYSSNGLRLHFGLNTATEVERIEILWPSGARQVFRNVNVNRVVSIHESRGIL